MKVFKIKTGNEVTYDEFYNLSNNSILVDHLMQYENDIEIGAPVFFLFGGDGTPWQNGLAGICKIATEPLDLGYETAKIGKYFKLKLEVVFRLKEHLTKMDFSRYPETFDTGIGPSTKGERNQALGIIDDLKAISSLCRAIIDKEPDKEKVLRDVFGNEIIDNAKNKTIVYVINGNSSQTGEPDKPGTFVKNFDQIIYYGVPGSGKSHKIDEKVNDVPDDQKMRVVFHPEYSNADFVGQILPKLEDGIDYRFKAGPFSRILKKALKNPDKPYYLIIEEINRGNAAAIFGELFQLLDRDKDGWSQYIIDNIDINAFIRSKDDTYTDKNSKISLEVEFCGLKFNANSGIKLPPNLSILATMNTSDQNVFTLDNAFQRRWKMILVENKFNNTPEELVQKDAIIADGKLTWGKFQEYINELIGKKTSSIGMSSMEDKRLGCWFVKAEDGKISKDIFAEKVLKYLWDDAFKFCREEVFNIENKNTTLESVISQFKEGSGDSCWNIFKDTPFVDAATE